jgi:hypothetical protein
MKILVEQTCTEATAEFQELCSISVKTKSVQVDSSTAMLLGLKDHGSWELHHTTADTVLQCTKRQLLLHDCKSSSAFGFDLVAYAEKLHYISHCVLKRSKVK